MAYEFDEIAFFKRLRELIRSKDESSDVLAAKCNMPLGSFSGYLYSQNLPTAGKLAQLCRGLETTADWLLFGDKQEDRHAEDFSRYRIIKDCIPVAEFTGLASDVTEKLSDYIAAYNDDVPALVELHHKGRWSRVAWIGVNRSGVRNAG